MSWSSRRARSRARVVVSIAAAFVVVASTPAAAVDLYSFRGQVIDRIGRPLVGVKVAESSKQAFTDANGNYAIGESATGRFTLTASRSDIVQKSETVDVAVPTDKTVDFVLTYRLSASLSDATLSTAGTTAEATLSITSHAPNPGAPGGAAGTSCVYVNDARTGARTAASHSSTNANGSSQWIWTTQLPAETTEATTTLSTVAEDCNDGTVLSQQDVDSYTVDNTPPSIADLLPADGTNTIVDPRLTATIKDTGGSGVNAATVRFTVTDDTAAASWDVTGASFNYTTGRAQTAPQSLTPGSTYRLEVTASDNSGNVASYSHRAAADDGGTLAVTATPAAVIGRVPRVPCTLGVPDYSANKRSVTCENVTLNVDPSTIALSGSRHGGTGFVEADVPLASAMIEYTNVTPESKPAFAPSATAFSAMRYDVDSPFTASQLYALPGTNVALGTVIADIPALASNASLVMADAAAITRTGACNNFVVGAAGVGCSADILHTRFVVRVAASADVADAAAAHAAKFPGMAVEVVDGDERRQYAARIPSTYLAPLRAESNVVGIDRDVHRGYFLSSRTLKKYVGLNTPYIDGKEAEWTTRMSAHPGICIGPWDIAPMTTAAGVDDGQEPDLLAFPAGTTLPDVRAVLTAEGGVQYRYGDQGTDTAMMPFCSGGSGGPPPQPYWAEYYHACYPTIENNTGWIVHCAKKQRMENDPYADKDAHTLHHWATAKSKSTWVMKRFDVNGTPFVDNMQRRDWDPGADEDKGNCVNQTVNVTVWGIVSVGAEHQHCDRWDITLYPIEPGRFKNEWRGSAWRSEREVAYEIGVEGPQNFRAVWRVDANFYAI